MITNNERPTSPEELKAMGIETDQSGSRAEEDVARKRGFLSKDLLAEIKNFYMNLSEKRKDRRDIINSEFQKYLEELRKEVFSISTDDELLSLNDTIIDEFYRSKLDSEKEALRYTFFILTTELEERENQARREIEELMPAIPLTEEEKQQLENLPSPGNEINFKKHDYKLILEQPIDWKHLAFVRTFNLLPSTNEKGQLCLVPTKETGPNIKTIHWSINHKVESHFYGCWAGCRYTVIVPAETMVKTNGVPLVLNHVDTFWDKELVIPEGSVILFREGTISETDLKKLQKCYNLVMFKANFKSEHRMFVATLQKLGYSYLPGGMWSDPNVYEWLKPLCQRYHMGSSYHDTYRLHPELLEEIKRQQEELNK